MMQHLSSEETGEQKPLTEQPETGEQPEGVDETLEDQAGQLRPAFLHGRYPLIHPALL